MRQLKLKIQPGRQSVALRETEAGLEAAIVQALTLTGHVVLQTSEHRRGQTCPRCGTWQVLAGGRGTSKGVPDLLVTAGDWPLGVFLGLEVKTARGRVSPEQQDLADRGMIMVVRSVEEAIAAVGKVEKTMRGRLT